MDQQQTFGDHFAAFSPRSLTQCGNKICSAQLQFSSRVRLEH